MKNLRRLLISMPQLRDPYFSQTTTLLTEFNEDGAMGLILNRPLGVNLTHIMGTEAPTEKEKAVKVYWGGPVQTDRGWILHEDSMLSKDSVEIEEGLFLSSSEETLQKMIDTRGEPGASRFRFFLGYAGWGPGQLEQEMAASSWITAPIDRTLIFDPKSKSTWERSFVTLGIDPHSLASTPQSAFH